MQYFGGRSASRRSPEDSLLGQLALHLQPRPLRCGRRSRPKEFARGPPGMAIEDVPFKRAVRAGMPPHVEQSLFHRAPVMRLILRRVRQRQFFPVRVPASGKAATARQRWRSRVPTLVAIRQVPGLFIGVKHLCFEARVSRRGTAREQPCLRARLGRARRVLQREEVTPLLVEVAGPSGQMKALQRSATMLIDTRRPSG